MSDIRGLGTFLHSCRKQRVWRAREPRHAEYAYTHGCIATEIEQAVVVAVVVVVAVAVLVVVAAAVIAVVVVVVEVVVVVVVVVVE
ncbi:hypothetical protein ElyMa_002585200 [Elysia marginata]|uniref:Uncharacterized protein n=1 Tax=Elysia marginata TaxID=1093978 RepID=A0AAV4H2W2_9GAST|nr:hypothetical protein ElyMa_002585200 [Elysia marginata]